MAAKTAVPVPAEESVPLAGARVAAALRGHAPEPPPPPARARRHHAVAAVGARHDRRAEGRVTLSRLAEAERVQPPSITRVVDSLVHAGLRHAHPERRGPPRRVGRADRRRPRARRQRPPPARRATSRSASARSPPTTAPCSPAPRCCSNDSPRTRNDAASAASDATRSRRSTTATTASTSSARRSRSAARGCSSSRRRVLILQLTNKSGTALGILTAPAVPADARASARGAA